MTGIGWEFFGIKFSMLLTMLLSVVMFLSVWLGTKTRTHITHVDMMAGDEGED
jgi:hypothetical protein